MFTVFMLSRRRRCLPLALTLLGAALLAGSCEKVPLLAPTGSTITLVSAASSLPFNGSADIIAQVIEASGTPPHSGTRISFTTNLGTIEPSEADTDIAGRAVVKFRAGTVSGTATITAISGGVTSAPTSTGATPTTSGGLKIAVGTAAVGSVVVTASPTSVAASGGSSTITARVFDNSGNALPGIPVSFSTDAGTLDAPVAVADGNGSATSILTTTKTAKVTATAGVPTTGAAPAAAQTASVTVTVNIGPSISLGAPNPTAPAVGQPVSVTLTITAAGATQSPVRSAIINWGDGTTTSLGSSTSTVQHVYGRTGTFTITATATDTNGDTGTAVSSVTVISATPAVGVTVDDDTPSVGQQVTFTINVSIPGSPTGVAMQGIHIDYGDGTGNDLGAAATTVKHTYTTSGTKSVLVSATTTAGTTGYGSVTLQVP